MDALLEARQLYREVREHKRLQSQHRQAARNKIAEMEALCRRFGFDFELVKGADDSHGREEQQGLT